MSKNHFLPFQIITTILVFVNFLHKMAAGTHFGCPKLTFDGISGHNGRRRSFFMSEIHFRSHYWPFQIDTELFFILFTKWQPVPILDGYTDDGVSDEKLIKVICEPVPTGLAPLELESGACR